MKRTAALWAAAFACGPAWASVFGIATQRSVWLACVAASAGISSAVVALRVPKPRGAQLPPGSAPAIALCAVALFAIARRDHATVRVLMIAAPAVSGWLAGHAGSFRASIGAVAGAEFGVFLALVGRGSLYRASGWAVAFFVFAIVALVRSQRVASRTPATAPAGYALALEDVSVSFGANHVLRSATLRVRSGEITALVGANGSGKTTLLRTAGGFVAPSAGAVILDEREVTHVDPSERARSGLALVSGAHPVFGDLTVEQNLRVGGGALPVAFSDRRRAPAGVLSGGEQRMLALAMVGHPRVLLADELSIGLDAAGRGAVASALKRLASEGCAVVVVDHDLPWLLGSLADRAALLADGAVTTFDDPATLLSRRADLLPAEFLVRA